MLKTMPNSRTRSIARASLVGIVANALLSVSKIIVGIFAGSYAVISDGIDSATDILTSVITLVTVRISEKPPDIGHPYGHTRAETIATKLLSFVIFFAGAQLAMITIRRLLDHTELTVPGRAAIYVTIVSIFVKTGLALYKYRVGRATGSSMLIADGANMRNDILISLTVLIGIFSSQVLHLPVIDPIIALVLSVWIMRVAFGIFFETSTELMDGQDSPDIYREIFRAVEGIPEVYNPHRTRIRRIGRLQVVDLDIEVDGSISVSSGHAVAGKVEEAIKRRIPDVYDVIVHVEPKGRGEHAERFGLSQQIIDGDQES
jgi:cation diffusion facilitator family transporter